MAAITGVYGLVGPQSMAWQITLASTSDTQSQTDLLTTSGLINKNTLGPNGLAKFMQGTYANAAAVETAFRALGGRLWVRQTGGTAAPAAIIVAWASSGTTPSLTYVAAGGASNEVLEVEIELPHSVIQ